MRIRNPKPYSFDRIAASELLFSLGSRTHPNSKFGSGASNGSLDQQQVTQIGMAAFVKETSQSDSGLDRNNHARPGNLAVPHPCVAVRLPSAFDISLPIAVATDRN
jgi:hypothetical protein